ncbi:MAG: hypothetical protein SP1CHLAM54_16380 [Chlamydiia bacterium]|nr:hypothetical protein [Chlamydiia bacterium]MCH9616527.1 hypothetical protein [Chlamydiia bacterium]MCH9629257.1 hypothetical protein [Chlamydiia bacterium]
MDKDDPFLRPIRPIDRNEQGRNIYIPPMDEDKKVTEDQQHIKAPLGKEKQGLFTWAAFIGSIKSFISKVSFRADSQTSQAAVISRDPLTTYLIEFKELLNLLRDCDHSEDIPFSQKLSHNWHHILEESQRVKLGKSESSVDNERLEMLVTEIQFYPPNEEHNLGYYLLEYAGEDWYPFPYMELIRRIHKDYIDAPNSSLLNTWLEQLKLLTS